MPFGATVTRFKLLAMAMSSRSPSAIVALFGYSVFSAFRAADHASDGPTADILT
jgi:hypothetical protein